MYRVNNFGWENEMTRSWVRNESQFDQLIGKKLVWINKLGSIESSLCWKLGFHDHLGFPSGLREPCWRGHKVQWFGIVFWTRKNWQFDCDLQVMKYTSQWSRYEKYMSKPKIWARKTFFHQNKRIFWKSLIVEIIKKLFEQKYFNQHKFSRIKDIFSEVRKHKWYRKNSYVTYKATFE